MWSCGHISAVCCSRFFQLRQLQLIRRALTDDAVKTLVHAFISSRLDYCNSLLAGTSDYRSFNVSRMSLPAWWLARGSTNTSHQCSGNFTGYPSGSGYNTRPLYWSTSVDTPPLHRISLTSVYQRRRSAAVTSCGQLQTLIYCTSRGHGQVTVTEVLLYAARQCGTVCLLAYVLLTLLQLFVDS